MVPPHQKISYHIEPILFSKIESKTLITNGIGGKLLFQQDAPCTPRHQVHNTLEAGAQYILEPTWNRWELPVLYYHKIMSI